MSTTLAFPTIACPSEPSPSSRRRHPVTTFLAVEVDLQMPLANSKTKFGKISSLLNNFKSLGQIFEALFSRFCTTLILLWRKYNAIGQVFILVYVHLVTLFANSETRC